MEGLEGKSSSSTRSTSRIYDSSGRSLASLPKGCSISMAICSTVRNRKPITERAGTATQPYSPMSEEGSVASQSTRKERSVAM